MAGSYGTIGASINVPAGVYGPGGGGDMNLVTADQWNKTVSAGLTTTITPAYNAHKVEVTGTGPTAPSAAMKAYVANGGFLLVVYDPPHTFSKADDTAFVNSVKAMNSGLGAGNWAIAFGNEVNLHWGSASAYQTFAQHYAGLVPTKNGAHTPLIAYNPAYFPGQIANAVSYYPGDSSTDIVWPDFYMTSNIAGIKLEGSGTPASPASDSIAYLASHHSGGAIPIGIGEWSVSGSGSAVYAVYKWLAYTDYLIAFGQGWVNAGRSLTSFIFFNNPSQKIGPLDGICAGATMATTSSYTSVGAVTTLACNSIDTSWANTKDQSVAVMTSTGWGYLDFTGISGNSFTGCTRSTDKNGNPVGANGAIASGAAVTDSKTPGLQKVYAALNQPSATVTVTNPGTQQAEQGIAIATLTMSASGGTGPYTWTDPGGTLPPGLAISSGGAVTGTPTDSADSPFLVSLTATDSNGVSGTISFTWNVAAAVSVATTSLPAIAQGTAYSAQAAASGGVSAFSWSMFSGSLPTGITLASSGALSGTPTAAPGTYSFTLQVTDSNSPTAGTATKALSITVNAISNIQVLTTMLPLGQALQPYTAWLEATGGAGGNVWTVASGQLPTGLAISGSQIVGAISAAAVNELFTLRVTDSAGNSATAQLAIRIATLQPAVPGVAWAGQATPAYPIIAGAVVTPPPPPPPPPPPVTFPQTILDVEFDIMLSQWTAATTYAYQRDGTSPPVTVTRGRPDETSQSSPQSATWQLNNRDARWTSLDPTGPYYPYLGRNTPIRWSVPDNGNYLRMEDNNLDASVTKATTAAVTVGTATPTTPGTDVQLDLWLTNWQPCVLAAQWTTTGNQRCWALLLDDNGCLEFWWSTDGTSGTVSKAVSQNPIPLGEFTARATLSTSNGVVFFYTGPAGNAGSTDGWTALGEGFVFGATSLFASTGEVGVGRAAGINVDSSAYYSPNGKFFELALFDGVGSGGTLVADAVFTGQAAGTTTFTDGPGNTWTLYGHAEISGRSYRYHGELSATPLQWDPTGTDVFAPVTAGGLLRRLQQGNAPLNSAMFRGEVTQAAPLTPVAYWPCEDITGSTSIASGIGGPPMAISGGTGDGSTTFTGPSFGSDSGFACSAPLPQWAGSTWIGPVPNYTVNGAMVCRFLLHETSGIGDGNRICRVVCTGSVTEFALIYHSGGALSLGGYDSGGNQLFLLGPIAFNIDNAMLWVSMELLQNGSNITYSMTTLAPGASVGSTSSGTLTGATVGRALQVIMNPSQTSTGTVAMGHISVQGADSSIFSLSSQLSAWAGEAAGDRFARLCAEEGLASRIVGAPAVTAPMGAQTVDTLPNLLQACEDVDRGLMFESRQALALGYRTLVSMLNQSPVLTLDYSQAALAGLAPGLDDLLTRNYVTVTRSNGSSFNAILNDGSPMSVSPPPTGAGFYTYSQTVTCNTDAQTADIAGWITHVGTVNEERYPTVVVNLARPEAAEVFFGVQNASIGDMIQIVNPPAWLPPGPVNLIITGEQPEQFGGYFYTITWNTIPESPLETGIWGDPVLGHLDTDGSTLAAGCSATSLALSVATASGDRLWSTLAADCPFDVKLGGEVVTVASVTGPGSPQTFHLAARSVNGVVKSHAAGEDVRLAHPMILTPV